MKRAPREALLRGLGGDATRLLYTLGWQEMAPLAPGDADGSANGTWLIAGYDELATELPACIRFAPTADPEHWQRLFAQASEGAPVAGIVWRCTRPPHAAESSAEFTARLETEIANLLGAVHAALADETVNLTGGLWIITERAVATESGEPVDPVQAALWGLGRTIIAEQPTLRCRLVDHDGADDTVHWLAKLCGASGMALEEPELALRQGKFLVPRLLPSARSGHLAMPRATDYVLAPTERGAIDNLRLTETEVAPPVEGEVQVLGGGRRPQLPGCAQCARSLPGRSGADRW